MSNLLEKIGLGWLFRRKTEVKTVRLDIVAEQVREFNEAKKELNSRINSLEERATGIDKTLDETLNITLENQKRLESMEENMNRIIEISENLLKKSVQNQKPVGTANAGGRDLKPGKTAEP